VEKIPEFKNVTVDLAMTFSQYNLPPIHDALVIGKRAKIGAGSVARAFQEMTPGMFKLYRIEHPKIEALLVRESDIRKIPEKELISRILACAEKIMDETDSLHVEITIKVSIRERIELE